MIWVGQQLHPDRPLYNMAFLFWIDGPVTHSTFCQAFQSIVDRSDALKTVIRLRDGVPQRLTQPDMNQAIQLVDFVDSADPPSAARDWAMARAQQNFDLSKCLFDCALLRIAGDRFAWFLNMHHLVTDGWSSAVLIREVGDAYAKLRSGQPLEAAPLPEFEAYYRYEEAFQQRPQFQKAVDYWRSQFAEVVDSVEFYGSKAETVSSASERMVRSLGAPRSERLRQLAEDPSIRSLTTGLTMFNMFTAVLLAVLYRLSGNRQLVIGAPVHNRPTPDFKSTIGLMMELFPFKIQVAQDETFLTLLDKVKREANAFLRFAQPGTNFSVPRHSFNVVLNYINVSFPGFADFAMRTEWLHPNCGDATHHLRLAVHDFDNSGEYELLFDVHSDVFEGQKKDWFVEHYMAVMDAFLESPNQLVQEIELVPEDMHALQHDGVRLPHLKPDNPASADPTILDYFDAQVAIDRDRAAVADQVQTLTYGELDARASRLAHQLVETHRIQVDDRVAVVSERSVEMIVGILGILKAGGAYVPIDPSLPDERVSLMLRDAQAGVALIHPAELGNRLAGMNVAGVSLNTLAQASPVAGNKASLPAPSNLAYVIYTSGSTGQPNGVLVEHRNVLGLVGGLHERIYRHHTGPLNVALVAPLQFDASVQQIFGALMLGHCLHIVPEVARADGAELLRFFHEHAIDVADGTPAHIQLMLDAPCDESLKLPRQFIIGGEKLPGAGVASFYQRFTSQTPLITNIYGVAECCVDSSSFDVTVEDLEADIPIGRPLQNSEVLILNSRRRLQPVGVAGEIAIGGSGVSRGYLNRDELTSQRFVKHPYREQERIYLTGDIGRYRPDGNLEFTGRRDNQVKIRGHRIELGEIEHCLRQFRVDSNRQPKIVDPSHSELPNRCPSEHRITGARVLDGENENGHRQLTAYFTATQSVSSKELREHLTKTLPLYMVPSRYIQVEKMPLTSNGKVDDRSLCRLGCADLGNASYAAAEGPLEEALVEIWRNVLSVDRIGRHDDFFELGGDSILAMQIIARINRRFQISLSISDTFSSTTVASVAAVVEDRLVNEIAVLSEEEAQRMVEALNKREDSAEVTED